MLPFTAVSQQTVSPVSGCELIAFDAQKLHLFAATVRYCEPHWHPAPELITVLSGAFYVVVDQQEYLLSAGDLLYINAGEVHSLSAQQSGSCLLTVQFSPALFDALHPAPYLHYHRKQTHRRPEDLRVARYLRQLLSLVVARGEPLLLISVIYRLLHGLSQAGSHQTAITASHREISQIKQGIIFINQHFDGPITLQDVASHTGMSYAWCSRVFKRISRRTFKEYLTRLRLHKARMLLRDTRIPITSIALMSGFAQHKLLIAAFNKYHQITPTQYRKQALSPQGSGPHAEDCLGLPLNGPLELMLARCLSAGLQAPLSNQCPAGL